MLRAAVSGALDFRQADSLSYRWLAAEAAALLVVEANTDAEILRAKYDRSLTHMLCGTIAGNTEIFKSAEDLSIRLGQCLAQLAAPHRKVEDQKRSELDEIKKSWEELYGVAYDSPEAAKLVEEWRKDMQTSFAVDKQKATNEMLQRAASDQLVRDYMQSRLRTRSQGRRDGR